MKVIKNKKYAGFSVATLLIASTLLYLFPPHFEVTQAKDCSAEEASSGTCTSDDGTASADWTWQVNVDETLTMTVTPDSESGATGDVNKFLRDKYTVAVTSNNGSGFTAGMTTKTSDTNLAHTDTSLAATQTIPTLTATTSACSDADCTAFEADHWGYSLDETTTGEQTPTGTYGALVGNDKQPITVLSSEGAKDTGNIEQTAAKDVYFGAKASTAKASGTYKGTVVFTVTSGTGGADLPDPSGGVPGGDVPGGGPSIGDEPQGGGPSVEEPPVQLEPSVSESPSTGTETGPSINGSEVHSGSTYGSYASGTRTYRSTASSIADSAAGTENNKKKNSTADDFISPLGVKEKTYTTTNIQHGSIITTILMCVAFLAAGIGIFFFILAKRRDEEEEDDYEQEQMQ